MSRENLPTSPEAYKYQDESVLDPLFDEAFQIGFGMKLEDIRQSQRYRQHREAFEGTLYPDTGHSIHDFAKRHGVHHFASMLSWSGDDIVSFSDGSLAKAVDLMDIPTPHEAALVATLNDAMLEKAEDLIGPIAKRVAAQWDAYPNADAQKNALKEVYRSFQYKYWTANNPGDDRDDVVNGFGLQQYTGTEPLFPEGVMWPDMERPNCLGMSVLLSAFAKRAGADFAYINEVTPIGHVIHEVEGLQGEVMDKTIDALGVAPTKDVEWYSAVARKNYLAGYTKPDDFHHSIMVRLQDGSWVQVDPYMGIFGDYSYEDKYRIDEHIERLQYYWPHMPGLTETDSLRKGTEAVFDSIAMTGMRLGTYAMKQREHVREIDLQSQGYEAFEAEARRVSEACAEILGESRNIETSSWGDELWHDNMLHLKKYYKKGSKHEVDEERYEKDRLAVVERFETDSSYRQRRIEDLISFPVSIHRQIAVDAADALLGSTVRGPASEFANPNYMPALMTLNHLRSWSENGTNTQSVRLLAHTSSQVMWHEAHQSDEPVEAEIVDRAERARCEICHAFGCMIASSCY